MYEEYVMDIQPIICPKCGAEIPGEEWVEECLTLPVVIVCADCDRVFKVRAKILDIHWKITE